MFLPIHKHFTTGAILALFLLTGSIAAVGMSQTHPASAHPLTFAPQAWSGRAMPMDITVDAPPFSSDRLRLDLTDVTAPPSNRALNAYLYQQAKHQGVVCNDLPVSGGVLTTNCDFPDHNLFGARYDTLTFVQEQTVFTAALPTAALSYLQQALYRATGTPNSKGYGIGLQTEAKILADHAGFAQGSATAGDLTAVKRHTEHVLNTLYGTSDPRYGDQDNDGIATNPGDGYGLLVYRQQLLASVQAAAATGDATTNIQTRAGQVAVALDNIGDGSSGDDGWATLLIEKAEAILAASSTGEAQTLTTQMAGMASRIYRGEELNDNGEIEPVPGEGGAQTAWRYTQYATEYRDGSGNYVRYSDSSSGNAFNDSLRIKLSGVTAPQTGERYWVYLVGTDAIHLVAGAVDGSGGAVDATLTLAGQNLAGGYHTAMVTLGTQVAKGELPAPVLDYLATLLYRAEMTPQQAGYGVGVATQANILANHAGFLRDAADAGNLTEAKRHAEHLLNTLYGTMDPRYGDHDNDGIPTNPGDGFGLLPYREQMMGTLNLLAAANESTENVQTRTAQVLVALDNIGDGDGDGWAGILIEQTNAFLNTNSSSEAKTLGTQIAALADRIYRGEELNDNGMIEPVAGEGGALTAYRYTQHIADFYPQSLTATEPTPTATATPTATTNPGGPTPTPTGTGVPINGSDSYEDDDQCNVASTATTSGAVQRHNFHKSGDTDWVKFDATAGEQYLIEVSIPDSSPADVAVERYLTCGGVAVEAQDFSFSPAIRLDYTAEATGPVYLKLTNNDPARFGINVTYEVAVRALQTEAAPGLLIIVAGQIKNNDPVQPNIYHVTDAVRQLFIDKGATDDQIYYIAPDLSRAGVDASATSDNVQAAITQWANDNAATAQSVTLYMMDHGGHDIFYLDKLRGEWITPADLDGWLDTLEAARPNLKINVIYEACESGSFVSGDQSISKAGRVVISSTDDVNLAWASDEGAIFSDHFLDGLRRGESLYSSYQSAAIAARIAHPNQLAWLDGDGDGVGTDDASQTVAAQRGFNFAGTFPDEVWPPFIAEVQPIEPDSEGRGVLRAQVRDDVDVDSVWAVIYPPSYTAPSESEELVQEALPTAVLLDQGNDWYGARYDGFKEAGTYRIVFFADDNQGTHARPVSVNVAFGTNQIYLPMVTR